MADIQAGKWTFCPNLLNRGSDFLNSIIVKLMLQEIHQQSYILPDMSQLNPKYFWIRLTSVENTLMFIFKLEVNIFSIPFNFRTNGISHITFFDIWCRNNIILPKHIKKRKKKVFLNGELNPGPSDLKTSVLTTELLCHYIEFGKNIFEYTFQCKNEEISVFSARCQLIS